MHHKILKSFLVLFLSVITLSCSDTRDFEKKRQDGYSSQPSKEDSWFKNPHDKLDPYGNLNRKDYQDEVTTNGDATGSRSSSPISPQMNMPDVTDLISAPEEQEIENDKLVSISVNENIPIKDVIIELARRAEVDAEVDKDISGGVIFIAKNKPFSEVIRRICNMAGLNYSFDDGVLKVTKDTPVIKSYKFNILDITRNSSSSISTSFAVGGASSSSGSSINGSSNSQLSSKSGDGDIWTSITAGVTQLIALYGGGASASVGPSPSGSTSSGVISVNKNAGFISVIATEKQHRAIKEYLDRIHIELTSQVLIEAKVVEVTLSDEFRSGINWNLLTNNLGVSGGYGAAIPTLTRATSSAGMKFSVLPSNLFGSDDTTLDGSVELLQTFGTTRALSNPRINALNNQFAVLNFSENNVYFDVEIETTDAVIDGSTIVTPAKTTFTSDIKSAPIGIVLALQPSIDLQKNEVLMSVRPTLTRLTGTIQDPGLQLAAQSLDPPVDPADLNADIPIIDTRELDTTLRIKSGEIMAIGGLLEEKSNNTDAGLPGLSSIPYVGNVFKSVDKLTTNVETVIFMKATIVPGKGVSVEDEKFYKKFTTSKSRFVPN